MKEPKPTKTLTEQYTALNKKYLIINKALELACATIKEIMPSAPMYICGEALAQRLNIQITPTIKDKKYFVDEAKKLLGIKNAN